MWYKTPMVSIENKLDTCVTRFWRHTLCFAMTIQMLRLARVNCCITSKTCIFKKKNVHNACLCKLHNTFISVNENFNRCCSEFPSYSSVFLKAFLCKIQLKIAGKVLDRNVQIILRILLKIVLLYLLGMD